MLQLIINADDLGLTPGCNAGIIQAMTEGIVTDTTLMINTAYAQDAVHMLKERGITRVGLHLNLTYGCPLLPVSEVPSLMDANGRFKRKIAESAATLNMAEVEREYTAQVEKFMATDLGLTHLDSHHHAHTYPEIIDVAIAIAQRLGVPLRQTDETVRQRIRDAGVATSDYFTVDFYGQGVSIENFKAIIQNHQQGILEIMCHPAVEEELIHKISSYNTWREKELTVLTSQAARDFIKENGIRLVNFDAVQM
jgi:hypothetical protein